VTGGTVVEGQRTEGFGLDPDSVAAVMATGPSVVFLCSPNNPTGVVEPRAVVEDVAERCRADGALLVVDEAYGQFADWTALDLVADDRPLVVCRTFSKTWAMAAARLGYLVGPDWVVDELEKVVLPYHLDAVTQLGGRLALERSGLMADRVAAIVAERKRMSAALGAMAVEVVPSGANFVLFRVADGDADRVWSGLLDRGVLVRNCSGWPRLAGHLRVTVGTPEETDAFLLALKEVLT
jgi:histidinol-phosphate aminotransferase